MPLLFLVSALVFVLTSIMPGDVTVKILGKDSTAQAREQLRQQLGLTLPIYKQYWHWLTHALHGNFGESLITKQPITESILQRLPVTISLVIGTLLVSLIFGVGLGIISAVRGGRTGRAVDALAMTGWVVPGFWFAAELVVIFAVKLRWFPAIGYVPFSQSPVEWLRSLVLPVAALSLGAIGGFAKYTRESMLDALGSEYIRIARANGVSARSITFRHAFKSAAIQVITLTGLLTVGLLIGTVFVETVFALPGLGLLMVNSVTASDIPEVQGVAMFFTLIVIAVNLAVDLLYSVVSPRVRVT